MIDYTELAVLRSIYLEDSWVLGIHASPSIVRFTMDFVLTPDHPLYAPPATGEHHSYRRGTLELFGVRNLSWVDQQQHPGIDATGEKDWGNIDSMRWESDRFQLEGSWGAMTLKAARVSVTLFN